jgi:protein TonB
MFESALEQNTPRRRLGRGAILSIVAHGVIIGLVLYISSRPSSHVQEKLRAVTFFNPPPPPPPPPPPAGGGSLQPKKTEPKKVIKKPDTIVKAKKVEEVPQEKPPDPPHETAGEPGGQPGGVPGGVAGGVPGGVVGGTVGGVPNGTGNANQVIPFGAGMQAPTLVRPPEIVPSKQALAMRIGGVALAKCVINLDGTLTDCRLIKSLPYMDEQLLQAARSMRYTPVIYQGHPQRVEMIVHIRVPTPS